MRDVNSFRERFKHWKETGELPYEMGVPKSLPGYDDGKDGVNFYKSYNDSGGSQWYVEPDGSITTIDGKTGGSIYTDNVYVTPKGNYTIPAGYTENEYNANLKNAAALSQPNSEMVSWTDASGKTRQDPRVIGMSAADPVGQFAIETAATATPMGALGRLGMYGLGRWGTTLTGFPALLNWARGKIISGAMNRSLPYKIHSGMANSVADASQLRTPGVFNSVDIAKDPYTENLRTISRQASEFLTGEGHILGDVSYPAGWSKRTYTEYPTVVRDEINAQVLSRMIANRKYVGSFDEAGFKRQFNSAADGTWTIGSPEVFKAYDAASPAGFSTAGYYDTATEKIAMKAGLDPRFVLPHEIRHKIDYNIPLSTYEKNYLRRAYGDTFLNLSKTDPSLNGIDMLPEMVTTNFDARKALLGPVYSTKSLSVQNKMIQNASSQEIIDAVERSNGYGESFINALRNSSELDKNLDKIANTIKDAMMYVGGAGIPIALAIPQLTNNELPQHKRGKDALPGFGGGKPGIFSRAGRLVTWGPTLQWVMHQEGGTLAVRGKGKHQITRDPGDGVEAVGYGVRDPYWVNLARKNGGLTESEARQAAILALSNNRKTLSKYGWYNQLPVDAKIIVDDIAYQIGTGTLLNKSPKFIAAVESGNWAEAARLMDWGNRQKSYDGKRMGGVILRNLDRLAAWNKAFNINGGLGWGDSVRNIEIPMMAPVDTSMYIQNTPIRPLQSPKIVQPEIVVPEQPKPTNFGYWGSLAFNKGFRQQLGSDMMSLINE